MTEQKPASMLPRGLLDGGATPEFLYRLFATPATEGNTDPRAVNGTGLCYEHVAGNRYFPCALRTFATDIFAPRTDYLRCFHLASRSSSSAAADAEPSRAPQSMSFPSPVSIDLATSFRSTQIVSVSSRTKTRAPPVGRLRHNGTWWSTYGHKM